MTGRAARVAAAAAAALLLVAGCGSSGQGKQPGEAVTFDRPAAGSAGAVRLVPGSGTGFTIQVPAGWRADEAALGSRLTRTKWTDPGDSSTLVLVDSLPGATSTPAQRAARVRVGTASKSGYKEVAFKAESVNGAPGYRLEYKSGGEHSVDLFVNQCGTGFAILGKAPEARFGALADTFTRIAGSLDATSC